MVRPRQAVRSVRFLTLHALAGLWLAGCAAHRPLPARPAPQTLPAAADLEAALTQRRAALQSLRALAQLRYRDPTESSSSREAIVVARPDHVRVEVLSLFGSLFVLTADGTTITAYARDEDTLYRGSASPEHLWRYTRLWMPVQELVDIVLGTPPVPTAKRGHVSFESDTGWIRLQHDLAPGSQAVWFSDTDAPVAAERRGADGEIQWHSTYGMYEDHAGIPIATRIGLEMPAWSRSVDLALRDLDVNPSLDDSIFALQAPPGSKVVQLDQTAD